MKKRNLHVVGVLFIFISIFIISCKNNSSSTSAIIEKVGENDCSYIYSKHGNDDKSNRVTHYCLSKCNECPTKEEIYKINEASFMSAERYEAAVDDDAKEETDTSDAKKTIYEKCPLNKDSTIYIDKSLVNYTNTIGESANAIKIQNATTTTTLVNITKTSGASLNEDNIPTLNISEKNIKNFQSDDEAFIKCGRGENTKGDVFKSSGKYEVQECSGKRYLVHKEDEKIKKVWRADVNEGNKTRKDIVVPSGWRYPTKEECSDEILRSLKKFLSELYEDFNPGGEYKWGKQSILEDRFWLQEGLDSRYSAGEQQYNACLFSGGGTPASSQDKVFKYLIFVKENTDPCN